MRNQSRAIVGLAFVGAGLLFLAGALLRVNVWTFCWPVGLIVLGGWLLLRPSLAGAGTKVSVYPLADVRRSGPWEVGDEEIWIIVGDVRLDLSEAALAPGESTLRLFGLVGEVTLIVPKELPVYVSSDAILTDGKVYGEKQDSWFTSVEVKSDGYASAAKRVKVETLFLVTNLKVRRP